MNGSQNKTMQQIKYLTQEETQRLFAKIRDRRDRALFKLMYDFGLRASEVGKLDLKDLDLARGRIWIHRLKGGVSGEYPLFRESLRLLRLYLQQRNNHLYPTLFLSRNKNPVSRLRIDFLFKRYAKKAKLPLDKHHAHALRHSITVHMLDAGQNQEGVKDRLGHKSIKSTDVYAKISSRKREGINKEMERAREIVNL
jgi:type 1 fimbriae regulatory protein FimB